MNSVGRNVFNGRPLDSGNMILYHVFGCIGFTATVPNTPTYSRYRSWEMMRTVSPWLGRPSFDGGAEAAAAAAALAAFADALAALAALAAFAAFAFVALAVLAAFAAFADFASSFAAALAAAFAAAFDCDFVGFDSDAASDD